MIAQVRDSEYTELSLVNTAATLASHWLLGESQPKKSSPQRLSFHQEPTFCVSILNTFHGEEDLISCLLFEVQTRRRGAGGVYIRRLSLINSIFTFEEIFRLLNILH